MSIDNVTCLIGQVNRELSSESLGIFDNCVCDFLDELSKELFAKPEIKRFPDVAAFAFWCRRANIQKIAKEYDGKTNRIGRGLAFHIAPSNVPINFAFSLVFGLLTGNSNVVRISEKDFPQNKVICECIGRLLKNERFCKLRDYITIVKYGHNKEINDYFSSKSMSRIIWGGDRTIDTIRESKTNPRCMDISFADRYSFAAFDEKYVTTLGEKEMKSLAERFYNDTYMMDQNACSSPHLILWINSDGGYGRKKFWSALQNQVSKYDLQDKKVMDKYTMACEMAAIMNGKTEIDCFGNLLYVVKIDKMPDNVEEILRGRFGMFFEMDCEDVVKALKVFSTKTQTCVVVGIEKEEIARMIIEKGVAGIDRIVDVGQAMDIGLHWDGYDLIHVLSREINY